MLHAVRKMQWQNVQSSMRTSRYSSIFLVRPGDSWRLHICFLFQVNWTQDIQKIMYLNRHRIYSFITMKNQHTQFGLRKDIFREITYNLKISRILNHKLSTMDLSASTLHHQSNSPHSNHHLHCSEAWPTTPKYRKMQAPRIRFCNNKIKDEHYHHWQIKTRNEGRGGKRIA